MGLVVDPNSADANSYVTLAEATIILGANPYADAWDALSAVPNSSGWLVDGAQLATATTIAIKSGTGTFEIGSVIQFVGQATLYSVTGETPTSVDISPALAADVANNQVVRRLTYSAKEKFLLHSTKTLDAQVDWHGTIAETEQPLRWPRFSVWDCDGNDLCSDCFPEDLKVLTSEFALTLADRDLSKTPALHGLGFSKAKLDVLEIEVDRRATADMMSPYVQDLIGCMGSYNPNSAGGSKVMELRRT